MTAEEIYEIKKTPVIERLKDIADNRDEDYLTQADQLTINQAILLIEEIDRRLDKLKEFIRDYHKLEI